MKALILPAKDTPLEYRQAPDPQPEGDQVVVHLRAAALNHRDVWISKGMYPGLRYPIILGSDGAGIFEGEAVVINPSIDWGPSEAIQGPGYHILGLPTNGTFAEKVRTPRKQLFPKPSHLTFEQAAALPLAGLTAYRAVFTKGQVRAGERVLITGIGGGVALFAFQFAQTAGAQVFVTSGSDEKLRRAWELGSRGGANYRKEDWPDILKKEAGGGFDLIIDSAGGKGFQELIKLANPGGRLVVYGGGRGKVPDFSPQLLFWRQLTILGTTMGNDTEFADMLALVEQHQLTPVLDTMLPLKDGAVGFQRMDEGKQFGKIVFTIEGE